MGSSRSAQKPAEQGQRTVRLGDAPNGWVRESVVACSNKSGLVPLAGDGEMGFGIDQRRLVFLGCSASHPLETPATRRPFPDRPIPCDPRQGESEPAEISHWCFDW
jgi:hypothetical protein